MSVRTFLKSYIGHQNNVQGSHYLLLLFQLPEEKRKLELIGQLVSIYKSLNCYSADYKLGGEG